jgi:ABC-type molybdate transport system substrate-binding protein
VLTSASNPETAAAFLAFLRSAEGQDLIARHGLTRAN